MPIPMVFDNSNVIMIILSVQANYPVEIRQNRENKLNIYIFIQT